MRRITLRISDELHTQLQATANASHRSMQGEVVALLEAIYLHERRTRSKKGHAYGARPAEKAH